MKEEKWYRETIRLGMLIGRFFVGQVNEKEKTELQEWRRESGRNEELLNEIVSPENLRKNIELYNRLDTRNEWDKWSKVRRGWARTMYYKMASCAAAVLLLSGVTGYWYFSKQEEPVVVSQAKIFPGSFRATLHIEGGKTITIQDHANAVLKPDSSIVLENNQLVHSRRVTPVGKPEINTLVVPRGGEFTIVLADGTIVWLNADSRLKYPAYFDGEQRVVELEGEAYFEVVKDVARPFIVKTTRTSVRVYGTAFNVSAYPGDSRHKTTLERGSIGLTVEGKEYMLRPDEQAVLEATNEVKIQRVNARRQSVWRTGIFLFENEKLEDIMAQLSRWYDVNIFFADPKAKGLHFSGELNRYEDVERLLHMIELTTNISFSVKGKTITILSQ